MSTIELPLTSDERSASSIKPTMPVRGPRPASHLLRRASLSVEQVAYLAIGVLSLLAHLWGLGDRALHHDETLHATYSWYLYVGRGYIHDPLLHGPFLYHFGALMFFLFGDNDTTARLGVALFGTALTLTPYLLRRQIGRGAALFAALYLLVSPSVLYMGRFIRHDMYSITFEMLVVVGIVRYLASRRPGWLYLAAAAFACMVTNQETSYLFLVIMGVPILFALLWRVWRPGVPLLLATSIVVAALVFVLPGKPQVDGDHNATRDPQTNQMLVSQAGPIFGWGPLETSDNDYALRIRNRADNDGGRSFFQNLLTYLADLGPFFGHPAILSAFGVLLFAGGFLGWTGWWRRDADGSTAWQRAREQHPDAILDAFASLTDSRRVWIALGVFLLIYTLLFTAFFTNLLGFVTGTTGSVLYWLAQHDVQRGGQPRYYYLVLLSIYEPLLLAWSLAAAGVIGWRLWKQRRTSRLAATNHIDEDAPLPSAQAQSLTIPLLLLWWVVATVALYSWAGEKMPWLLVHQVLPMSLLAGWGCEQILRACLGRWQRGADANAHFENPGPRALAAVLGAVGIISALGFMLMGVASRQPTNGTLPGPLIVLAIIVLLFLLLAGAVVTRWRWRWGLGALALAFSLVFGVATVRNSFRLSFLSGDTPREMMIYVQTSPDVTRVVQRLERASLARTNGLDMPIIYDNETIWMWYFRNFTHATASGTTLTAAPGPEVEAVLMLQENLDTYPQNKDRLSGFRLQRLPLRWWVPEDEVYRLTSDWRTRDPEQLSLLGQLLRNPFDSNAIAQTWEYLAYRDPNAALGSTDFVLAVRPDLADEIGLGTGADNDK